MPIVRIGSLIFIGLALITPVHAEAPRDWYVGVGAGWDYAEKVRFEGSNAGLEYDRRALQPLLAVGARFGDNWRVELEGAILESSPEILYSARAGIEVDPDDNDLTKASNVMVNMLYDFNGGIAWRPYVGVGIGMSKLDFRLSERPIDFSLPPTPRIDIVNDQDTALAYQIIAGFTVPVSRRLDLAADYRYWKAPSTDLKDVSGNDLDIGHTVHSAWLHLRYHAPDRGVITSPAPRHKTKDGFYVETKFGGIFTGDAKVDNTLVTIDAFDLGPITTLALGYSWGQRWLFELEGAYRQHAVDVVDFRPFRGEDAASGKLKASSLMANVIYRFAPNSSIRPKFGLGAGMVDASFNIDYFGVCEFLVCRGTEQRAKLIDDEDKAFAYHAIIGVDVAVSSRLTFTTDARYWITSKFSMRFPNGAPYKTELDATSVQAGLRYTFGN
jgi:opacity protein-like surface antigen